MNMIDEGWDVENGSNIINLSFSSQRFLHHSFCVRIVSREAGGQEEKSH